eukprot:6473013-Heterocapsa_arctica.AAC.1
MDYRVIRAHVVAWMQLHSPTIKPFWDEKAPDESDCFSWRLYLELIGQDGAWGGALELRAAAVHFGFCIAVLTPQAH